jgi:hypothetical protein
MRKSKKPKDLTGQKFNMLTAIEISGKTTDNRYLWKCVCDCGNFKEVTSQRLQNGDTICCGCRPETPKKKDLIGSQFGKLTVISVADKIKGRTAWNCICSCGGTTVVTTNSLTTKNTESCGCENLQNQDLSGQKFGRITVIHKFEKQNDHWCYLCNCSCGNECLILGYNLLRNKTKSCGCLRREIASMAAKLKLRELNHRWKGGITVDYNDRMTVEYSNWRKIILQRDGCCQICGDTKKLVAHHLDCYIQHPEKRTSPENGVCLCETCHICFHIEYGYGQNTPQQFIDFKTALGV